MDSTEIIVREVERKRGLQVVPLFRERVCQPRQSFAPLAKRTVLALDLGRAGTLQVRVTRYRGLLNRHERTGAVAFASLFLLAVV